MGLIVDTNVFINAERKRLHLADQLDAIRVFTEKPRLAISVVTLTELAHGETRARSTSLQQFRTQFLEDLVDSVPLYGIDAAVALRAGRLDGLLASNGIAIGFPDLLIAATAAHNDLGVFTYNVKHFSPIPALRVVDAAELPRP